MPLEHYATRHTSAVWLAWLLLMAGANLATPLYEVYAQRFQFSSLLLTAIFATYAVVLVPSLVLFGRLSDRIGRRLVILLGLASATCGLALFAAAQSTAWLFAARVFQGLERPRGNHMTEHRGRLAHHGRLWEQDDLMCFRTSTVDWLYADPKVNNR